MKQVAEVPPAVEPPRQARSGLPEPPLLERSPDQDDFDRSFRAVTRSMGELLRSRRKNEVSRLSYRVA
ncbi:MAG TPA: hypothetical protein VFJ82_21360 [Longimicrobium sp.]|nr:hypothetical protein [Longimicrobium sp.]